ncbi:DNA repair protein RecN (Recombination protein N) [Marinospirillum celere]|uniref:DNA repair protein RecN n=1 Tax=Marinospirillum celere TaxID=1122252 RepID=A0A1I1I378_9GAMM|nr:DNA repair protein RecN [Marinospirillum celere]SFC30889.1 DNA repair protein RecN (Recombination protein N) [Marinospirillum celere]
MLISLSIQQLAIVEQLELEFRPGMTVITGETGAGKSILLQALGLALGDRADSDSVRHGAKRAEISARFDLSQLPQARAWLESHDLDSDECILRRSLLANGRSKAWINGQPCPVNHLKELGECLLDIHGQHAHQSLLRKETHLPLLDDYAGLQSEAEHLSACYRQLQQTRRRLESLRQEDDAQRARIQLLRYQVEELDQLALGEEELAELEAEQQQLANAENLIRTSQEALYCCDHQEEGAALQQINQALQLIENLSTPALDNVKGLLNEALIQVQEASHDLEVYLSRLEIDPARLQWVEERLNSIYQTARKHHLPAEELPEFHQQLRQELAATEGGEGSLETLTAELEAQTELYRQLADEISQKRHQAAEQLEKSIDQQLGYLGMEKSQFRVSFQPLKTAQPQGKEEVEFLIAPNPGQPPKPLVRIASGGELSRISLAIQVVTAETSSIPTLVFDEVDVGISGAVAEIVGRLLKQLAERGQILCVTHLPQVAAQGDQHLHIHKTTQAESTLTQMQLLDEQGRVAELARMLGGVKLSDSTLAHAREMLQESRH